MQSVLAIGSSHLFAIQRGYERLIANKKSSHLLNFVQLRDERYRPHFAGDGTRYRLNAVLQAEIEKCLRVRQTIAVLACVGGGKHIEVGLTCHPRPFDFVLPDFSNSSFDKSAEFLSYGLVRDSLERIDQPFFTILRLIRELTTLPIWQLCPPPPINDSARIAHAISSKAVVKHQVAAPELRYKLWRVQADNVAAFCQKSGIEYIRPPAAAIDNNGYLKEQFVSTDAVHGNVLYGELALEEFFAVTSRKLDHASV